MTPLFISPPKPTDCVCRKKDYIIDQITFWIRAWCKRNISGCGSLPHRQVNCDNTKNNLCVSKVCLYVVCLFLQPSNVVRLLLFLIKQMMKFSDSFHFSIKWNCSSLLLKIYAFDSSNWLVSILHQQESVLTTKF